MDRLDHAGAALTRRALIFSIARPQREGDAPMNRTLIRGAACACAALSLSLSLSAPAGAATRAGPVVATDNGKVQGRTEGGVAAWLEIPLAAAPAGALRRRPA